MSDFCITFGFYSTHHSGPASFRSLPPLDGTHNRHQMSLLPSAALIHAGRAGSNYSRQLSTSPLLLSGLHSSTQQLRSPSHHTPSPSLLHNAWLAAPRREHRSAVTWVPVPRTASATATSSALPSVIRRLSASLPLLVLSAYHQHRRRAWGSSAAATLGGAPFALTAILLYFTDGSGSDAHCYSAADAAALGSGSGAGVWGPLVRSNRSGGGGTSTAGSAAASSDGGRTRGGAPQQQSRGGAFRFSALGISSAASATDDDEQYARDFDDVDDAAYDMAAAWPHELGFQASSTTISMRASPVYVYNNSVRLSRIQTCTSCIFDYWLCADKLRD